MDHQMQRADRQQILNFIQTIPIIDHHAHNLLLPSEQQSRSLLSITTEATGEAMQQTASTLAHLRAVQQLAEILQCEPDWNTVQSNLKKRKNIDNESWAKYCFHGIETVLIDDGLDAETVHPYKWHDRLTRSPCKRIVRLEKVAEQVLAHSIESTTGSVFEDFASEISRAIVDPEVVGFKSVICYRTGLAIPRYDESEFRRGISLASTLKLKQQASRLQDDVLGPGFVHLTAQLIAASESNKPLQFHSGLGDNDIRLPFSSPSHLQSFIERYPTVPIVLLHASYPFTKEAGYLASVYRNVYMDIGEVFPMVSKEGQESVVRESLELCPSEKLMWSTDGHWFPETYLLAILQIREILAKVLLDYVDSRILTVPAAIKMTQDILFSTSNQLYDLKFNLLPLESSQPMSSFRDIQATDHSPIEGLESFRQFLHQNPTVKYIRLQWVDYTATPRVRILPVRNALDLFTQGKSVSVTKAVLGLLQTDAMCPGFKSVGHYEIYPIMTSLHLGARPGHSMVECEFRCDDGQAVPACPRTSLRASLALWANHHGRKFLVGFEIEVVFMNYEVKDNVVNYGVSPITQGQSWSSARALHDDNIMNLIESIMDHFERCNIGIQQFHAESAPGQFEFVMDPKEPIEAVDDLIFARDIIATVASKRGLRATLVSKAHLGAAGTGSHVHVSMVPSEPHQHFLAGLLKNLSAIAAITYPNVASYERVADSSWSGGTWISWGTQNRETPVRYISGSRYEIKCLDGFANPYLALRAILGAGVQGIVDSEPLTQKDCLDDPALLSPDERQALGITQRFPGSFDDALNCFRDSALMREILGDAVYGHYLTVKQAENEMLQGMETEERRRWLIERY